jgi:hypothetical protein
MHSTLKKHIVKDCKAKNKPSVGKRLSKEMAGVSTTVKFGVNHVILISRIGKYIRLFYRQQELC